MNQDQVNTWEMMQRPVNINQKTVKKEESIGSFNPWILKDHPAVFPNMFKSLFLKSFFTVELSRENIMEKD